MWPALPTTLSTVFHCTVTTNLGSQSGVPNLFGLPAPVYAGTVLAGAPNTAPTAAARARSAPAASVDKSGTQTALQDQRLTNYEARLRQEDLVSPVPNAMTSASVPCGTEHSQMDHPWADSASNPLRVGELSVLGHAIKSTPTDCLLVLSSHM